MSDLQCLHDGSGPQTCSSGQQAFTLDSVSINNIFHFKVESFVVSQVFHPHSPESSSRVHFLDRLLITTCLSKMKVVMNQIYKMDNLKQVKVCRGSKLPNYDDFGRYKASIN